VTGARFRNVPAFVWAEGLRVPTSRGEVEADVAFGGAFYASVAVERLGLAVAPRDLPALIELGREIKHAIEAAHEVGHPDEPELRDVYGVIFFQAESGGPPVTQRNVTVFADGEVDRSPCGSGTSARLALLHARGEIVTGEPLLHLSIVGTEFEARVVEETPAGLVTEVGGRAHRTGEHRFVLEPDDPLGTGFVLR
jgi:proline racemase